MWRIILGTIGTLIALGGLMYVVYTVGVQAGEYQLQKRYRAKGMLSFTQKELLDRAYRAIGETVDPVGVDLEHMNYLSDQTKTALVDWLHSYEREIGK